MLLLTRHDTWPSRNATLTTAPRDGAERKMTWSIQEAGLHVRDQDELIHFCDVPSYAEFRQRCLIPNRPCILPRALVAHWDVIRSNCWESNGSSASETQHVNWEALKWHYGTHVSPVVVARLDRTSCKVQEDRSDMTISNAVDLIQAFRRGDLADVRSIYIKDWHLIRQLRSSTCGQPGTKEPYVVPEIFADDWMNNVSTRDCSGGQDAQQDDFRFVYAGTCGSQTLLHRDVYTSYSWSTNVVGVKKWFLLPPHTIPALRRFPRVSTSPLIPDIDTLLCTLNEADRKDYPHLADALAHMQVITQHAHETIFIPSNWYHQVHNLTDCISINRNWCNSHNIASLYHSIVQELQHVEQSLCDVREILANKPCSTHHDSKREFYALVQDVAVKDAGWAWHAFWQMLLRNLTSLPTEPALRPHVAWMSQQLLPLTHDFEHREDARWLDPVIRTTAQTCKSLLDAMVEQCQFLEAQQRTEKHAGDQEEHEGKLPVNG